MTPALFMDQKGLPGIIKLAGTMALAFSIAACHYDEPAKNNGKSRIVPASELTGTWEQRGYGQILEFAENTVTIYQYNQKNCIKLDEVSLTQANEILGKVSLTGDGKRFNTIPENIPGDIHSYTRHKLDHLPQYCLEDITAPDTNYQANYDVFWHTFNDYYAFFDIREVDWANTNIISWNKLKEVHSNEAFFNLLKEMLEPIDDGHINLENDDVSFSPEEDPAWLQRLRTYFDDQYPQDELRKLFEEQEEYHDFSAFYNAFLHNFYRKVDNRNSVNLTEYLDDLTCVANDNICYGMVEKSRSFRNVGYLRVDSMYEYSAEPHADFDTIDQALKSALDNAIETLYTTDALIIDVRRNPGGYDSSALEIAGRFTQNRLHAFSKKARHRDRYTDTLHVYLKSSGALQYTKPVYLLISGSTYSGAEIFSLVMRNLPQVTLIGEPTGGILSDSLTFELPNGWEFSLSNEVYISPKGERFESIGIPPQYEALYMEPDDIYAGKDTGMEKALSLVK
ncbi:peptidase [Hahella sp. CCB-MM4]|uniref:S41 family peptidase n=1 Tax=Hahella sp. (strain CCB-MM4) TaxID=1926491 RepID=UPI000B9A49CB|nr:S41 family peptidase [Hahella sp. CCB-MM4]OZG74495.1 peptidase [Hahella sp. CCB-MM4]